MHPPDANMSHKSKVKYILCNGVWALFLITHDYPDQGSLFFSYAFALPVAKCHARTNSKQGKFISGKNTFTGNDDFKFQSLPVFTIHK